MVRPFCGFPMIDCYQEHDFLSLAHVLIVMLFDDVSNIGGVAIT